MKAIISKIPTNIVGMSLFLLSFLFIISELIKLTSPAELPFYTINQAIALAAFIFSAYFCFISRFRIKYPDLIFSVYSLQFLLILFVWLVRFNH